MTEIQLKALRGMLACKLYKTDAVEAGIDACRSDTYRAKLAQFKTEYDACLDWHKRKEMKPPRAEPVKGAEELRKWLSNEYDRIMILRENRKRLATQYVQKTLRQRCLDRIRGEVADAYAKCHYRQAESSWAGGQHTIKILPGHVVAGASGYSEVAWSANGKWKGSNSTHTICVMSSWYNRVYKRGMACVDGILTLDAEPISEGVRVGEEAYKVLIVVGSRGVSIRTEEGILYRKHGGEWVHGTSVKNARTLNNNRIRALVQERIERMNRRAKAAEEMEALSSLVVTREDCTAAGLCDAGQRDWLAKRGLGEETRAVPASKLLEMAILSNDRVSEVRRAIRLAASKASLAI